MLTELMDTLGERGAASADELARHLGMERGAVDPLLECLLRKGRIRVLESCSGGCGGCRSCGQRPVLYVLNRETVSDPVSGG